MLFGRERERQVIGALVSGARVGRSGALVLVGEAGIGKSALLDDAAGGADRMCLLRAVGTPVDREVPFGGLLQLLRPALHHLDRIPAPQAEALGAALALRPGTGADRFAVGAGTLSLLSRLAEDQPVLVLVDDAHLLDEPSAHALAFATRRLTADPVAVVAAVRQGQPSALVDAGLPVLTVAGLSDAAACDLLAGSGRALPPDAVDRLQAAAGGNPLALLELAADPPSLAALPPDAPLRVPRSLADGFGRRADQLPAPTRTALLVAAAAGADLALVAGACAVLDVPVDALDAAENAQLVSVSAGRVSFRHGLVRSAVYSAATAAERRQVHRAVAAVLPSEDVDRRAWHLAEGCLGPDDEASAALERSAARARARSAHAVAARGFERAAELSPQPAQAASRLVSAAECAWLAGGSDHAADLLRRAGPALRDPGPRVRADWLRGTIAVRTGSAAEARDVLVAAGRDIAPVDPGTAVLVWSDAILACFLLADVHGLASVSASIESVVDHVPDRRSRWVGDVAVGVAGVLTGAGGLERLRRAVEAAAAGEVDTTDPQLAPWLVTGPLFLRESATGRELVEAVVTELRRRTAIGGLSFLLFELGRDQATTDRWQLAHATYSEGVQLARETGRSTDLAGCLAGLAWLEARLGLEETCREHATEALRLSRAGGLGLFHAWSLHALAELELARGMPEPALAVFEDLAGMLDQLGVVDPDLSPAPERVELLLRLGRDQEASDLAARFRDSARAKGQPWAMARAARALALTGPADELDAVMAEALLLHARAPGSFELARTRLAWGARLRRERRRADARAPLRAALRTFDELGAAPWAEQAVAELRATGERAQRRAAGGTDDLTPQELQVARLLAAGRTTRQAAAVLFLSPKTVEYHQRHVYLKLGIASRAELAERFSASS